MKSSKNHIVSRLVILAIMSFTVAILSQTTLGSSIGGFVYDKQRNPIIDVDVELLDSNNSPINRAKTNGVGGYQFDNVADGRYFIRVMPFRYDFEDQTQEIVVNTFSILGGGSAHFDKDFYLDRKKGGLGETITGVIFTQDVPEDAEKLFKQANDDLTNKRISAGLKKLIEAIEVFPNYYAASYLLGIELLKTRQYLEATKLFLRAAEINPTGSKAFYYMGFALSRLGNQYNKAALQALRQAVVLAPRSFEVALLIGKIEREERNFVVAEDYLLKAKKLARAKIPEIHIELAQLYANDLKRYSKAADELELYLKASNQKDEKIKHQIASLRNKASRN